eukprot:GHVL01040078.1.p1 GENE.GHVL01040078.1~~GHVL01040078.1.p1  ORF type:complete len:132 (+),score=9.18 GHVL01040078.1:49-444(+)
MHERSEVCCCCGNKRMFFVMIFCALMLGIATKSVILHHQSSHKLSVLYKTMAQHYPEEMGSIVDQMNTPLKPRPKAPIIFIISSVGYTGGMIVSHMIFPFFRIIIHSLIQMSVVVVIFGSLFYISKKNQKK